MFQSNGVLYENYYDVMSGNSISGFRLEIQYPLAKNALKICYSLWLTDEENFTILNSNSCLEML